MITIHGIPISVHTRKVIVAAALKGIDYVVDPVIPFSPPANWDRLSPTGRIPVITEHDGESIADSSVICAYMDRLTENHRLYPDDARNLARVLWLEEYCDGTLFPTVIHGLFQQKIINPRILSRPTDETEIEHIRTTAEPKAFAYIESQIETGGQDVETITVGDIALASNLVNYMYLGFRLDESLYPSLAARFCRIVQREPFRQALQAEAPFADRMGLDRSFLL